MYFVMHIIIVTLFSKEVEIVPKNVGFDIKVEK